MLNMRAPPLAVAVLLLASFCSNSDALAVMSIDFGNEFMKIAIVKPGVPMEVALNEESLRKTNTIVSFRNGERHFSGPALATQVKYPKNAYWYLRDLLAKSVDHHQVEIYKQHFPYYNIELDTDSNMLVFKDQSGETYSPEELIGMIIEKARIIAEKFAEQPITEAVLTVPPFFTQAERRAMTRAVEMSGLKILQLMNDNAAVALNYGVFRRKEFNTTAVHYMFFDMGATKTTATVVAYQIVKTKNVVTGIAETNPQLTIKGVGYDRNLGGLDFQLRLRDHLARQFNAQKKTNQDVFKDDRAMAKLFKEAERVKKVLSSNKDHYAQVESLLDDQDFKVKVTREELEDLCKDLFDRVAKPVEDAIKASEVTLDEISEVILMGGGTRVPLVQDILMKTTNRNELGKSINTDEAAALGAVYQAAYLSKGFKVKNFHVKDMTLFPIQVEFARVRGEEETPEHNSQTVKRTLFGYRNPYPQKKVMTFNKHVKDFYVDVNYGDMSHLSAVQRKEFGSTNIQRISIEGVETAFSKNPEGESKGVKAHFKVDESGILTMDKAEVVFEKTAVEDGKEEESTLSKLGSYFFGSDKGEAKEGTVETSQEAEAEGSDKKEESEQKKDSEQKEESQSEAEEKAKDGDNDKKEEEDQREEEQQKEESEDSKKEEKEENKEKTDEKAEEKPEEEKKLQEKTEEKEGEKKEETAKKPKTVVIKENLMSSVNIVDVKDPTAEAVASARKRIEELTRKDKEKQALAKSRNDLETFIVDMQDKLWQEHWEQASTESERQEIRDQLSAASDWLYEQDDDTDKNVYKDKLKDLKKLTRDLTERVKEHEERPRALEALNSIMNYSEHFVVGMKNFTGENQPFTEVEMNTLEKLIKEIKEWNATMTSEQQGQPLTERPKLLVEDIGRKMADLDREVKYLINKAKNFRPKVPKADKNKTEEAKNKSDSDNSENKSSDKKSDDVKTDKEEKKAKKKPKQKQEKPKTTDEEEILKLNDDSNDKPESESDTSDSSDDKTSQSLEDTDILEELKSENDSEDTSTHDPTEF